VRTKLEGVTVRLSNCMHLALQSVQPVPDLENSGSRNEHADVKSQRGIFYFIFEVSEIYIDMVVFSSAKQTAW
jgi:hypothetical protein